MCSNSAREWITPEWEGFEKTHISLLLLLLDPDPFVGLHLAVGVGVQSTVPRLNAGAPSIIAKVLQRGVVCESELDIALSPRWRFQYCYVGLRVPQSQGHLRRIIVAGVCC